MSLEGFIILKQFDAAGLHLTYPKDKKAAMRAAEVLAESHLQRSSSDSSDRASLTEHPDDVVSHLYKLLATAGLLLAPCEAIIFSTLYLGSLLFLEAHHRQTGDATKAWGPNW